MAYTMDRRLVLSKWYSINPQQAMDILAERGCPGILVHQGHLIRQKLALTSIDPAPFFATRVSYRSSPSTRGIILGAAAFLMSSTVDVFTRLGEILFLRPTGNLNLDGPRIHVRAISSTPAFRRALGKMSSFHTVQNGMVWTNDEWYLKIVTDLDEITATREVSEKAKVLEFGGELRVTTGEHTGKTLMATRTAGERIDADCLSEIEDSDVRCAIVTAIKAIHAAGWHHHDLQPRNVVVRDGQVTIIDFGSAQRASVCLEECCCPDRDAIGLLTISPSSSTETVVDLPPEMGEILAESVEDLEPKVKT
ncbi:hypothetical protein C8R44DRAFT_46314 [Mycena epipterygia]|nr:hypothetical protein C8R44DRAFT_46314 [Mycena epipterygia]